MGNYSDVTHGATNGRSYNGQMMQKGQDAEEVVISYLTDSPNVIGLDDLRELRPMQRADVDVSAYMIDGRQAFIEIKSDKHISSGGNFCYEFLRINHTCRNDRSIVLGWTARTPAKYVLVVNPGRRKLYIFQTDLVRSAFQSFTLDRRPGGSAWISTMRDMQLNWVSTDQIKSTLTLMLPLAIIPGWREVDISNYFTASQN